MYNEKCLCFCFRIAFPQKISVEGWMGGQGRIGGSKIRFNDCLQQSEMPQGPAYYLKGASMKLYAIT